MCPAGHTRPGEKTPQPARAPKKVGAPVVVGGQQEASPRMPSGLQCWYSHASVSVFPARMEQEDGRVKAVVSGPRMVSVSLGADMGDGHMYRLHWVRTQGNGGCGMA